MPTPTTSGIRFFQYTQSVASDTWNIYHAFGYKPLVDINVIVNGTVMKAFPLSIVHIDENKVRVTWSAPYRGYASIASTVASS